MASLSIHGVVRLTRDAEVFKSTYANWVHFGVAAFRKNPKEGQQDVDFFEAEYYMKNPDSPLPNLLRKGRVIYLDRAEIRNNKFKGNDGSDRYKVKISIFSFDFVDQKPEDEVLAQEPSPSKFKKKEIPKAVPADTSEKEGMDADAIKQMFGNMGSTTPKKKEEPKKVETKPIVKEEDDDYIPF